MGHKMKYMDLYSYDPLTFRTSRGICCTFIIIMLSLAFFCIECYDYLPRAIEKQGFSVELQVLNYFNKAVELDVTVGLWEA